MQSKLISVLALSALGVSVGCQPKPHWPEPERHAALAAGLDEPIAIRVVGSPVDEAEPDPSAITPAEAIRLALTSHPEIQAAIARVRMAQAEAHQERLLPNPVLDVALRFAETGGTPVVEAGLSAELLSLLQKPGRVRAADHRLRVAATEAVTVALDVLAQVQECYAGIQTLDSLIPVLEERRGLTGRLLTIADSRLKAGEGTRLDVTTLRAQEAELSIELISLEQERRELRLQLARLIGQPTSKAVWELAHWAVPVLQTLDESAWIAAALEHRPEIQTRMAELSALGVEARLARWILTEGTEAGIESERDDHVWSAGPSIRVPLPVFDWGQARRELADARRIEAAHQLVQLKRQAVEDVRRALAGYQSSSEAARRVREELLPLVEQRGREAEAIYRAGQDDILMVILAQQELRAGQIKLIELERRAAEAFIRLQRAVGGPAHLPAASPIVTPKNLQTVPTSAPTTQPLP